MVAITKEIRMGEFDYDEFFYASLPKLKEGTILLPDGVETDQQIYDHFKNIWDSILIAPDCLLMGTYIDDWLGVVVIGHYNAPEFVGIYSLVRPNANGSRSYIYDKDVLRSMVAFKEEKGITNFYGYMSERSPLRNSMITRRTQADFSEMVVEPISDVVIGGVAVKRDKIIHGDYDI